MTLIVHRINARRQLFHQLQQFCEQHLVGLWTIGDIIFDAAELLPKEHGRRQLPRETVSGHFGPYTIVVSSPEEKPPLGEVICTSIHGMRIEGILDPRTFEWIAEAIKLDTPQGGYHVDDRRRRRLIS